MELRDYGADYRCGNEFKLSLMNYWTGGSQSTGELIYTCYCIVLEVLSCCYLREESLVSSVIMVR